MLIEVSRDMAVSRDLYRLEEVRQCEQVKSQLQNLKSKMEVSSNRDIY